jgi:putative transposase
MDLIKLAHCVYHCDYHVVIVTKYRREIFNPGVFAYFKVRLAEITEHYPQIKLKQLNHDKDHLHLLISVPPTMSVGKAVGIIKANTAKDLKQKFPFIKQTYWGTDAVWSEGYFVTTVGANEAAIKKYIEAQGREDLGQTLFDIS